MQDCTILTIFDGRRAYSEDIYVTLTRQQSSIKTYIVEKLQAFKKSILDSYSNGQYVEYDKYKPDPQRLLKKFTACYTYLYIA